MFLLSDFKLGSTVWDLTELLDYLVYNIIASFSIVHNCLNDFCDFLSCLTPRLVRRDFQRWICSTQLVAVRYVFGLFDDIYYGRHILRYVEFRCALEFCLLETYKGNWTFSYMFSVPIQVFVLFESAIEHVKLTKVKELWLLAVVWAVHIRFHSVFENAHSIWLRFLQCIFAFVIKQRVFAD